MSKVNVLCKCGRRIIKEIKGGKDRKVYCRKCHRVWIRWYNPKFKIYEWLVNEDKVEK